jgi:hypothetical protein
MDRRYKIERFAQAAMKYLFSPHEDDGTIATPDPKTLAASAKFRT